MPRIDLTECARRYGWLPTKSGRESVRRWFLDTPEKCTALGYDVTTGRGTVDEAAFSLAIERVRAERRARGGPAKNFGAHATKGLSVAKRKLKFKSDKAKQERAQRAKRKR